MTDSDLDIARAVEGVGFLRRSGLPFSKTRGHKEWLHFAVHGEGVRLLLNFSVVDDLRATSRMGAETGRVTCLVHDGAWDGDVDSYDSSSVSARGGSIDVHVGPSSVTFRNGAFHLVASLPRRRIEVDLLLEPDALPSESNNVFFDDCPPLSWVVLPRLRATGDVVVGANRYQLRDAPAYHDHNWGHFRWGGDFVWEWGYALPELSSDRFAAVFVRFLDRGRLSELMRGLLLWRGPRQARIFREDEIRVSYEGFLGKRRIFKVPRPMALVAPTAASDVPARIVALAAARGDHVELCFEAEDVAQVIAPNDAGLGVTVINEVSGRVHVDGVVDGERFTISGPSTFEFLQ